jgi:predicted DNA-binding protein
MQEVPISREVKQRLEAYCRSTGQGFDVVLQEAVQQFLRNGEILQPQECPGQEVRGG